MPGNHYEDNILRIEKYREGHCWTAVLNDADQGYPYLKRFQFEASAKKQSFIGGNPGSTLIALSDERHPRFEIKFGGGDEFRGSMILDADEFISVKSFKAKGKRISNYTIESITETEPKILEGEEEEKTVTADISNDDISSENEEDLSQSEFLMN